MSTTSKGSMVMACMTPAVEGTRVSIENPEAVAFRAAVIEGLMLNHPHDCPVCDEGGECHLQDMTVMTGHDYRRYRFNKRTFQNQNLGPMVQEMNRCIQCYRCVRFYREYAGGRDFDSYGSHNTVFFGRQQDGVLESEFAGNLVEVCPTGVFTDKTLKRHYTRKWDLQMAPSICVHCGRDATSRGERYGSLRRILNRYNGEVNGYFLCDRGRYGYEFVNSAERIREPLLRQDGELRPDEEGLNACATCFGRRRPSALAHPGLRSKPILFFARWWVPTGSVGLADAVSMVRPCSKFSALVRPDRHPCWTSSGRRGTGPGRRRHEFRAPDGAEPAASRPPTADRDRGESPIPLWLDDAVSAAVQDEKGPLFIAAMAPPSWTMWPPELTAPPLTTWRDWDLPSLTRSESEAPGGPGLCEQKRWRIASPTH